LPGPQEPAAVPPVLRSTILLAALLAVSAPLRADVTSVDLAEFEKLRERGVPLVDLRTPAEWSDTGVIEGSHLLTFADARGRFDAEAWATRLTAIAAPGEPVALICARGGRSTIASRILDRRFGYGQVFNVLGGIEQWVAEGRTTVRP